MLLVNYSQILFNDFLFSWEKLTHFFETHNCKFFLLSYEIICGIEPRVKLFITFLRVFILWKPLFHFYQSMSELFKIPQEKYFLSLFMFANNDNLSLPFHVDHKIETKLKISWTKRELFVPFDSELVCSIDIVVDLFEELKESEESIFRKIMFHVLDETFYIFSFISISIKFVTKKLPKLVFINSGSELIRSFLTRYDKFKLISMTKDNPIKMFYLLFLSYLESINKDFSFWFGNDEEFLFLLENRAMSFINTQGINFDVILFDFIRTNVGLTFLQFINQQTSDGRILWNVNNVGLILGLLKIGSSNNGKTCFL